MKMLGGRFNGTGATLYLCFGFVPDFIELRNEEAATPVRLLWDKFMGDVLCVEGILLPADGGATQDLAAGEGVRRYYGEDTLTSALQTSVTYGEGVYLEPDNHDYRYPNTNGLHAPGDAVAEVIDTWTLDTSANRTGHFNEDVTGTYIGEGSKILIDPQNGKGPREYTILALTAGQGEAADEVTLNDSPKSGKVRHISGMYTMKPMAVGSVTLPGIRISNGTLNADGNSITFMAGMYD